MNIKIICYRILGVGAHVVFLPIGLPSVLLIYGVNKWRPKRCCPSHDFMVFEIIYFWPLLIPLTIPSIIRNYFIERKKKKDHLEFTRKKQKILEIIQSHKQRIGFQSNYPENAVETLVTDTLDYLEKGKRDITSYNWAEKTVKELDACKIENIHSILIDCEYAWNLKK